MKPEVKLKFKDTTLIVPICDSPKVIGSFKVKESVFSNDMAKFWSASEGDRMYNAIRDLCSGAAIFWSLIPKEICKIYFNKNIEDPTTTEDIINWVTGENAFREGTKERELCVDLIVNYRAYKRVYDDYLGFDINDIPLFSTKTDIEKENRIIDFPETNK